MRDDLDMLAHVPPDFTTAMGLVCKSLVAAGLEFRPVVGQDIGRNGYLSLANLRNSSKSPSHF